MVAVRALCLAPPGLGMLHPPNLVGRMQCLETVLSRCAET